MKTLASALLGAALATAALALSSALSPASGPQEVPDALNRGRVITGFSVLPGGLSVLGGLTKNTPVTIRSVSEKWIEIDYPTQVSGPVWINTDLVVSFRVER